ncbi:MAG: hypothetical protein KJO50_02430 [Bacteroidia bacterium]|nr:hypothetical protein [Bacteroidia bacterium]MBT8229087.1 hypothetical protein [Bacteroidia bacterium]NNK90135.1 hypothetical protein [Saprospiraceae bacterium]
MKVEKTVIDDLNAELKLTIEKEDYLADYKNKMNSYQQKSHMKGFRKGKTPLSMIQKMYGSSTMQETVSKILSDKINEIITGDEFNIIGEPLLLNEDKLPVINYLDPGDYIYEFQLGLEPVFDVRGIDDESVYPKHNIEIDDTIINEEVENICKRMGVQESTDDAIIGEDLIYFDIKELEGDDLKEGGHESEAVVNIDKISEEYSKKILGKKKGDTLDVDIFQLEQNVTEEYVKKHFLKLEEDEETEGPGNMFRAEIADVVRVKPAAFDQDLFDKYFGKDEVKSEEEAREKIKGYIGDYFKNESVNLLNRQVMQALVDKNEMELPEGFLRKWLTRDSEITDEQFDTFKKELKWRIIKKKLVKRFEVEVKEDEIFNFFVNAVRNYSPYIDEASLKNTVYSLMQNREQLNSAIENISSGKLFDAIREVIKIEEQEIDKEGFYNIVKELNQKADLSVK